MEGDIGHVLARVLIQLQNGTERIAPGEMFPLRDAICTNVKVDGCLYLMIFLQIYSGLSVTFHYVPCVSLGAELK